MIEPKNAFGMLAGHLRRSVRALEIGKGDGQGDPLPGSRAIIENQDDSLRGPWGQTPARDANTLARLLCISASDHLLAMADSLESTSTGAFVCYTIGRGVLEAAGRAWYLSDPGADIRERVRRYMNERLWNINEARRFLEGLRADTSRLNTVEHAIQRTAEASGFTLKKGRSGWQLDSERPSAMKLCDLVISPQSSSSGFGTATYRFISTSAHASESGIIGHLGPFDGIRVSVEKSSETQARYLLWCVKAYLTMGDRFLDHFGWDKDHWTPEHDETLGFWIQHAKQGLEAT